MNVESINDFIAKLTPEEREQHKDLIQECKVRELHLKIAKEKVKVLMNKYEKDVAMIFENLNISKQEILDTAEALSDIVLEFDFLTFDKQCRREEEKGDDDKEKEEEG